MSVAQAETDHVNMVPLIDCMFFLILFFMIITKFTPDEKAIASLLPTDKGQGPGRAEIIEQINLALYPAGFERGHSEAEYQQQLHNQIGIPDACLRIGGSDALLIRHAALTRIRGDDAARELDAIVAYVERELESRDTSGLPRNKQPPVVISCHSSLPWKYALAAYDAVRAHEAKHAGRAVATNLNLAREVSFAPPRIRNYSQRELGAEIDEILHLH
jgi:hypothetical protein